VVENLKRRKAIGVNVAGRQSDRRGQA